MMDELIENSNAATTENDENIIKVRLKIAERTYNFHIKKGERAEADEERLRTATKMINEEIERCREKHKCPESQDALSLAIMTFALEKIDGMVMRNELSDLNVEIENYLQIHEKK
ncbi:MAG: cell division protein ZapA [Prevotellaceae bacterium]|jgi:hypothetical protein|nr:cell division protein ZapA [Prevotellaceae bacterium]